MKTLATVIFSLILLCAGFAACSGDRAADLRLDRADALMNSRPDSALTLLRSLSVDSLRGGRRARYALLYTKAATKNYTPLANDSLIRIAGDYYAGRGDSLEIQSLYYQGEAYSYAGVLDSALVSLHNAFDKALAAGDNFYAGMSAREIAAVYGRLLIPKQQLVWAKEAKEQFISASKPVHAAWMDMMISDALMYTDDLDSAERVLSSIDTAQYNGSRTFRHGVLLNKKELAVQKHRYSDIVALYDILIADGYRMTAHDYCRIADAKMSLGNYDSIRSYLSLIESLPWQSEDTVYINRIKAVYLNAIHDYQGAYKAACDLSAALIRYDSEKLTNPQTLLLTDTLRDNIAEEKLKAEHDKMMIWTLTALCVVVLALAVMVVLYLRTRLANKSLEAEKALNDALHLKNELEAAERRLNDTLEQSAEQLALRDVRHKGLVTGIGNLFSRHVELLQNLAVAYYSKSGDGDKDPAFYRGVEATVRKVQSIGVVNELWTVIDSCFDGWMTQFKAAYPDLKDSQYLLAMYIRIGLSSEAITVLTGKKSLHSIYVEKNKLKKRMLEINGGTPDEFMADLRM